MHTVAAGWLLLLLLFSFYFSYLLLLVMHRIRACPEWLMSFAATCHPVHGVNQVLIFQYTHTLGRSLAWMRLRRVFLLWADGCAPPTAAAHRRDRLEFLTSNLINLVKFWIQQSHCKLKATLLLVMSQFKEFRERIENASNDLWDKPKKFHRIS